MTQITYIYIQYIHTHVVIYSDAQKNSYKSVHSIVISMIQFYWDFQLQDVDMQDVDMHISSLTDYIHICLKETYKLL